MWVGLLIMALSTLHFGSQVLYRRKANPLYKLTIS